MYKKYLIFLFFPTILFSESIKIGFGSCFDQNLSYEIWNKLKKEQLDYFIFMGDNVYVDRENHYEDAYIKLFQNSNFKSFLKHTQILAIWDDHDYGKNDAGKEFKDKNLTKRLFIDYWYKNNSSKIYNELINKEGIYHSYEIIIKNKKILVLLLDTRWFRDPLKKQFLPKETYLPDNNPHKTLIGNLQWEWLEKHFQKKTDLIILVSSIQILPEKHRFEKWYNFPLEKERLINLIKKYHIKNIIILSGDRHFAEISLQYIKDNKYNVPLYEFTSSSLNQELPVILQQDIKQNENNSFRISGPFFQSNYGLIEIKTQNNKIIFNIFIKDTQSKTLFNKLLFF
ncbi:MAG: hypothetical protein KatS3mg129_1045 [Leptospiraceae bacterium]|nr:MAG: hypothetical protein KatS3mg129_1045 [Leptospiraceae bacterium]